MDRPFPLLEIYHRVRNETAMTSACTCTNPSGLKVTTLRICLVDSFVICTGRSLLNAIIALWWV